MLTTFKTAAKSSAKFVSLALKHDLRLVRQRLGYLYAVEGGTYSIFRETHRISSEGQTVILVVGFRLKLIRNNELLHWLFQRLCIFSTPFWSGIPGFKVKLWMVDPHTKNYLGIYDWKGKQEAGKYIEFLLPILKYFSVPGSVWAKQLYVQDFEQFLSEHKFK